MTAHARSQVVSHERQTAPSTAPMPNARPERRGQAPKPRRGAPKAQGLTAAIAVAAPSPGPSIAPDGPVNLNSTGADTPMNAFPTSRIYTRCPRPQRFPPYPGDNCSDTEGPSDGTGGERSSGWLASRDANHCCLHTGDCCRGMATMGAG